MVFVATVLASNLPYESHLSLEASNVTVTVKEFSFPYLQAGRDSPQRRFLVSKGHSIGYLAS